MAGANSWWVTWQDVPDATAARKSALIWGPQASPPPQLSGMFQAGPFPSDAAAKAYEAAIGTGAIVPKPGTPIVGDQQPPANPLNALKSIGDFFGSLGQAHTWIRVAEVALGLVLLAVGVARITHAVPIATKVAKTAGAVALA